MPERLIFLPLSTTWATSLEHGFRFTNLAYPRDSCHVQHQVSPVNYLVEILDALSGHRSKLSDTVQKICMNTYQPPWPVPPDSSSFSLTVTVALPPGKWYYDFDDDRTMIRCRRLGWRASRAVLPHESELPITRCCWLPLPRDCASGI